MLSFRGAAALAAVLASSLLGLATPVQAASDFPTRPISIVVPFPAGGGVDAVARIIVPELAAALGQPVIVENRPGARTQIGTMYVANAAPDGYTLLLGSWSTHATIPALYAGTVKYDPVKDFVAISMVCTTPYLLAVPNTSPARSLAEFIVLAKQKAGALNYGSWGPGSSTHLLTELFQVRAGVGLTHVPYRGSAPALTDLIAGRVDFVFDTIGQSRAHWEAGNLRVLAVTTAQRSPLMPSIPTVEEQGVADFVLGTWYGLFAPKGTPNDVVAKIEAAAQKAVKSAEVERRLRDIGAEIIGSSSAEFTSFVAEDSQRWRQYIGAMNIKLGAQ